MHDWLHDVQMVFGSHVSRVYEMHFHLRPPFWRRGLGSEAANAVLQHAFSALRADLHRAAADEDDVDDDAPPVKPAAGKKAAGKAAAPKKAAPKKSKKADSDEVCLCWTDR